MAVRPVRRPVWSAQRSISEIVMAMRRCPQPIVALIDGAAAGGGFALALASDVRIATPTLKMNAAFIRIGLSACDIGVSYFLPRMVGSSVAAELMLTGRFIRAERALGLGLVSAVVEADALEAEGELMVADMLGATPLGLRLTKECLNHSIDAGGLEAAVAMEDRNQILCAQGEDFREGVAAFLEKRERRPTGPRARRWSAGSPSSSPPWTREPGAVSPCRSLCSAASVSSFCSARSCWGLRRRRRGPAMAGPGSRSVGAARGDMRLRGPGLPRCAAVRSDRRRGRRVRALVGRSLQLGRHPGLGDDRLLDGPRVRRAPAAGPTERESVERFTALLARNGFLASPGDPPGAFRSLRGRQHGRGGRRDFLDRLHRRHGAGHRAQDRLDRLRGPRRARRARWRPAGSLIGGSGGSAFVAVAWRGAVGEALAGAWSPGRATRNRRADKILTRHGVCEAHLGA